MEGLVSDSFSGKPSMKDVNLGGQQSSMWLRNGFGQSTYRGRGGSTQDSLEEEWKNGVRSYGMTIMTEIIRHSSCMFLNWIEMVFSLIHMSFANWLWTSRCEHHHHFKHEMKYFLRKTQATEHSEELVVNISVILSHRRNVGHTLAYQGCESDSYFKSFLHSSQFVTYVLHWN